MTGKVWVRRARNEDVNDIVAIFRSAFDPWILERLIYGSRGIQRYIEIVLAAGDRCTPVFFVAGSDDRVLAAAEVGVGERGLILSYIATRAGSRSLGLATLLIGAAVRLGLDRNLHSMELDVFTDNTRAAGWYRRLGFETVAENAWWESSTVRHSTDELAMVSGLPQAEVCQRAFGFSEFTLLVPGRSFRIGRLGDRWFRLTDPGAMDHPQVQATLASMDDRRRLLIVGPISHPSVASTWELVARSDRLSVPLPVLMQGNAVSRIAGTST